MMYLISICRNSYAKKLEIDISLRRHCLVKIFYEKSCSKTHKEKGHNVMYITKFVQRDSPEPCKFLSDAYQCL
jgi:hypothetical protein